ncbi:MAG TPA: hypothetical protein VFD84_11210 [Candidatus Binatia bacterium]|nr:hypothetical protein [Candidatus Binatia bacterium]
MSVRASLRAMCEPGPAYLLAGRAVQLANGLLLSAIVIRRFGLDVVGSFALGIAAVTVLAKLCPLGLAAYLPRLDDRHPRVAFTGLGLLAAQAPVVVGLLAAYALWEGRTADEARLVFAVALGGYWIAFANVGLMLSIMRGRFRPGLLAPMCETTSLVLGAGLAPTPTVLAVVLLAGRFAGVLVIWGGFSFERVPAARLVRDARRSAHYLGLDVLSTGADDVAPLILAGQVTREELGLFRLCQQLLGASDSPCWTFVQSRYPDLVARGRPAVERLARQLLAIGGVATVVCLVVSFVLAHTVLRTPAVVPFMLVLAPSLAFRFRSYLFGQAFRAAGRVWEAAQLGVLRLLTSIALCWSASRAFGVWGAVWAIAAIGVIFGIVYAWRYRGAPAAEPAFEPPLTKPPSRRRAPA